MRTGLNIFQVAGWDPENTRQWLNDLVRRQVVFGIDEQAAVSKATYAIALRAQEQLDLQRFGHGEYAEFRMPK